MQENLERGRVDLYDMRGFGFVVDGRGTRYFFRSENFAFGVPYLSEGDEVVFIPRPGSPSPVADCIRSAPTKSERNAAEALLKALSE